MLAATRGGVASKPQGGAVVSSEGSASRKAHDVECMAPRIWPSRQLSLPLGPNVRGAKVGCHIFGHTQTDIYSGVCSGLVARVAKHPCWNEDSLCFVVSQLGIVC